MNEKITYRQAFSVAVIFMISGVQVMNVFTEQRQNLWLVTLLAAVIAIPALLLYARLNSIYPDKNLFEILSETSGRVIAGILTVLYIFYAVSLSGVTLRYMTEFIQTVSLPETPKYVTLAFLAVLCMLLTRGGAALTTKFCSVILPAVLIVQFFILIFSFQLFDFTHLRPIFAYEILPTLNSAASLASFTFNEAIFLVGILASYSGKPDRELKKKSRGYGSVYFPALLLSGIYISLTMLSNLLVLGKSIMEKLYFPYYAAVSVINVADFITHIEIIAIITYVMTAVVKISICLYAASLGVKSLFGLKDEKNAAIPLVLLASVVSMLIFRDVVDMFEHNGYYKYEAFVFQLVIPFFVWLKAEADRMRNRKRKLNNDIQNCRSFQ